MIIQFCEEPPARISYKKYLVYVITNLDNGLKYYGVTTSGLETRWRGHLRSAMRGKRRKSFLNKEMWRWGPDRFSISIIQECQTEEEMLQQEIFYITRDNTTDRNFGYNTILPHYTRDFGQPFYDIIYKGGRIIVLGNRKIENMSLIKFNVAGNKPSEMCVFKLIVGKKFFIWKSPDLDGTIKDLAKSLESKIKKLPAETELYYLLASYMKKNRVFNCSMVVLFETGDVHELLKFEQAQLDQAAGAPDCLNNSFQAYYPKWVKDKIGIEPAGVNPEPIKEAPVIKKKAEKVTAPPFIKKPVVAPENSPEPIELNSNHTDELVMPDFDVDEFAEILQQVKKNAKA